MRNNTDFYFQEIRKIAAEVSDMPVVKTEYIDAVVDALHGCIEMFDYVNHWWARGANHYRLWKMVYGGKRVRDIIDDMIEGARIGIGRYYMEHLGFIRYTQKYMCTVERLITLMYIWTAKELYYYPSIEQEDDAELYTLTDQLWEMIPQKLISTEPDGVHSAEEARQRFYFSKKKEEADE